MVTDDELLVRLGDEEDALVERKPQPDRRVVREAVCAFANSVRAPATGILFLGVNSRGEPNGLISDPDRVSRDISSWLSRCYPLISGYELHALRPAERHVVAVVVSESRDRPHFTGPAFVRDGSQTREASASQFEKLIEDRSDLVWALRPHVGHAVAVVMEADHDARGRIWLSPRTDYRLIDLNLHFATVQAQDGNRFAFSLRRVYLERLYTAPEDLPLLRVRLG